MNVYTSFIDQRMKKLKKDAETLINGPKRPRENELLDSIYAELRILEDRKQELEELCERLDVLSS